MTRGTWHTYLVPQGKKKKKVVPAEFSGLDLLIKIAVNLSHKWLSEP